MVEMENGTQIDESLRELVPGMLLALNASAKDIDTALQEWLQIIEEGGNEYAPLLVETVQERLMQEDPIGALLVIATGIKPGAAHKSVKTNIRRSTLELQQILPGEGGRKLQKHKPSPTLQLGSASHAIIEKLRLANNDISKFELPSFRLGLDGEKVTYLVPATAAKPRQFEMFGQAKLIEEIENPSPRTITLEEPLPAPLAGQSITEWAADIFRNSITQITAEFTTLPHRPYDVGRIITQPNTRQALIQALEAVYVIFGDHPGLELVQFDETINSGYLKMEYVNEYAALNWLAIIREFLALIEGKQTNGGDHGLLTELPIGDIQIDWINQAEPINFLIRGGKVDLCSLSWQKPVKGSPINLSQATQHIESLFGAQSKRFRKVRADGRESSTRLGRNFYSLISELWRLYGGEVFENIIITIEDEKFPAGDGGWFTSYDPNRIPLVGHKDQIEEYLFLVTAQLAKFEKWLGLNKEIGLIDVFEVADREVTISLEEIINFAKKYNIFGRIKGELHYQLPSEELVVPVMMADVNQLEAVGARVLDQRTNLFLAQAELRILQALSLITNHRREDIEVVMHKTIELPETARKFCIDHYGKKYLVLEMLKGALFNDDFRQTEGAQIESAMYIENDQVYIFWVRGLIDDFPDQMLRIAVDQRGKFAISGFMGIMVTGTLLTELAQRGVGEDPTKVVERYIEDIWKNIVQNSKVTRRSSIIAGETVTDQHGGVRRIVVDKPIACTMDPLTGRWFLDVEALGGIVAHLENLPDPYGLKKLHGLAIKKASSGNAMCPLPWHDNRDTAAVGWYGDHLHCFRCDTAIEIRGASDFIEARVRLPGVSTGDYLPVSSERNNAMMRAIDLGGLVDHRLGVAATYLESRGINPAFMGKYGSIPVDLSRNLSQIIANKTFIKFLRGRGGLDIGLDQVEKLIVESNKENEFREVIVLVRRYQIWMRQNQFTNEEIDNIQSLITIKNLLEMERRGLIGQSASGADRLGGRLLLPTYWPGSGKIILGQANINGRGIVIEAEQLYEGSRHYKAFGRASKTGLYATPTGVWLPNISDLFDYSWDKVIIFEGPVSMASCARFIPGIQNCSLVMSGLGYKQLIAFLRWMGVANDPKASRAGLIHNLKTAILANDFDKAGAERFNANRDRLRQYFPGLEVIPIHDILPSSLPSELISLIPTYNRILEGDENIIKIDWNDLLLDPRFARNFAYQSDNLRPRQQPLNAPHMF